MNHNTAIIKVCGENLSSFFQNIISNDINKLSNDSLLYTTMLSPQGKFLYDFFLKKEQEYFFIEINKNESENFILDLKKYDLRENLKIFLLKDARVKVLLFDEALKLMGNLFSLNSLEKSNHFQAFEDPRAKGLFIRVWITDSKETKKFSNPLISSEDILELHRIKKCIPNSEVDLEKNKSFLLNYRYDEINAISFEKGCYVGQENTAKQKYRGKLKYKLKVLKLINGKFPRLNENLICNEKKIGVMKSSINNFGLALIKSDLKNANTDFEVNEKLANISIL